MTAELPSILLVEDDAVDVIAVQRALSKNKVSNPLHVVSDGDEALEYLVRGAEAGSTPPPLVLLDLNLPRKHGLEVLADIRADPRLRPLNVVVLTTSERDEDVNRAYAFNAAGYIVKPVDFYKFVEAVRVLDLYWTLSQTPQHWGQVAPPKG